MNHICVSPDDSEETVLHVIDLVKWVSSLWWDCTCKVHFVQGIGFYRSKKMVGVVQQIVEAVAGLTTCPHSLLLESSNAYHFYTKSRHYEHWWFHKCCVLICLLRGQVFRTALIPTYLVDYSDMIILLNSSRRWDVKDKTRAFYITFTRYTSMAPALLIVDNLWCDVSPHQSKA